MHITTCFVLLLPVFLPIFTSQPQAQQYFNPNYLNSPPNSGTGATASSQQSAMQLYQLYQLYLQYMSSRSPGSTTQNPYIAPPPPVYQDPQRNSALNFGQRVDSNTPFTTDDFSHVGQYNSPNFGGNAFTFPTGDDFNARGQIGTTTPTPNKYNPPAPAPSSPPPPPSVVPTMSCNGSPLFCLMRFDQYTFPATYRSGSYNLNGDCTPANLNGNQCSIFSQSQCYFYNHGNRDLLRQLADGIRSFNFQTCIYGTSAQDSYAVLCQTVLGARALGEDVADTITALRSWLDQNPNEVVEIEFDTTENAAVAAPYIVQVLQQKLNGIWLRRSVVTNTWPTLQQLITAGKRVVVWMSDQLYTAIPNPPSWILLRNLYYLPSLNYTQPVPLQETGSNALTQDQLQAVIANVPYSLTHFCEHPDVTLLAGRWQNLDLEFPTTLRCPYQVANPIQQLARSIAFFCLPKVYFHRLRAMSYFVGFNLTALTRRINLTRYKLLLAVASGITT